MRPAEVFPRRSAFQPRKLSGLATQTGSGLVETRLSWLGHRLPACGADRHLACRFARNRGQDARSPTARMAVPRPLGFSTKPPEVYVPVKSERNSERVRASSLKQPSKQEVFMTEFCFSTPRIIMQRCFASTTTATPDGCKQSMSDSAI